MVAKKFYIETYGCQMNFSDSEIVASIMTGSGYVNTPNQIEADIVLLNTCSIRDNAEQRIFNRLKQLQSLRKKKKGLLIGVLGCMAERLKTSLLEEGLIGSRVDLVVGPDAYRDLPNLLLEVEGGQKAINTLLSAEETYADITPVRYSTNGVSAYISITRGCENYCSYCVVPFTRGKERSRNPSSIVNEARQLFEAGFREVTVLGQNVNSYEWKDEDEKNITSFTELIEMVAKINPLLRVRFATSHPKDISDQLLEVIARNPNLCKAIHLPVQSGSSQVLERMNRKYSRDDYLERIVAIRRIVPSCSISTDIITGFCGETNQEFEETLDLMKEVGFDFAFMFKYSEREGTIAALKLDDNVAEPEKIRRLQQVIDLQQELSLKSNKQDVGTIQEVLVEGVSKRSARNVSGRSGHNKVVVFPDKGFKPGEYVMVRINTCTAATLLGEAID